MREVKTVGRRKSCKIFLLIFVFLLDRWKKGIVKGREIKTNFMAEIW